VRFFRLLARIRYWRNRALRAETRIIEISAQAEAERYRNMSREDMFASAAALQSRGIIGIPPRTGPAQQPQQPRLVDAPDPMAALSYIEKMEFQTQWLAPGLAEGHSKQRVEQDFLRELANRKSFNDEPSM
jgi:hypothetical protein